MITCEVVCRHVDAVIDGEVDPTTQIEFEQHLCQCGPCRVHLSFARAFKRQLKDAMIEGTGPVPAELAERIRKALDAESVRAAAMRGEVPIGAHTASQPPLGLAGVRLVPVKARYAVPAAAAAVALAVLAAREGGNPVGIDEAGLDSGPMNINGASYFDDIVERHWRDHPAEVSGPPMQVASWFRGKLDFSVRPMEFASPDVRLVGARISSVRDREAAAFYYDVHGRRVTVLVFEPATPMRRMVHQTLVQGRGIYYAQARGYTVPVVEHGGLTYAIAGDLDSRALLRLAASARVQDR